MYSLGVVAYQCLTGRVPFDEGESIAVLYAHVNTPLPRPALATAEERALFAVVERMLAKDPAERFQTTEELIGALVGPAATAISNSIAPTERLDTSRGIGKKIDSFRPAVAKAGKMMRRASTSAGQETARAAKWITRFFRSRPVQWITASRRRVIGVAAAAIVVFWGGKTALHFALKHGSRCPDGNGEFQVMLDPVGTTTIGRDLDVYYDVCGLERGAPYTVRLQVSQQAGGIRGLFGGRSSPVTVSFDEEARGPATRRHRTIEVPGLEPGSYALELSVAVGDGGDASRRHDFQLVER
jgi:hypothetical protein